MITDIVEKLHWNPVEIARQLKVSDDEINIFEVRERERDIFRLISTIGWAPSGTS